MKKYFKKLHFLSQKLIFHCLEKKIFLKKDVPEVLNVHMNESKKNLLFLESFFSSREKLTFEKENLIFFNTYLNFNLFYLIVVIFCKFRLYERSELQVHYMYIFFSVLHDKCISHQKNKQ